MVNRQTKTPGWARDAALAFAATAAARELATHARYGDCIEVVAPADRPRYDATLRLVRAERRAAVTLLRDEFVEHIRQLAGVSQVSFVLHEDQSEV